MASIRSNLPEITTSVNSLASMFDLKRRTRGGGTFGDVLVDEVAFGIYDQTVNKQQDPNGSPLKPLKPSYLAYKRRRGQPDTISVATGEMMNEEFIKGDVQMDSTSATIAYHGTEETDEKAQSFQDAGREFMGISKDSEKRLDGLVDVQGEYVLRELGG